MGSHKRVRLYKETVIPPHGRRIFTTALDNDDCGYWKLPYEMLFFFKKKIGEEVWQKWESYDEELEIKPDECKEFQKLLEKAVELHEKVIGNRWAKFDKENEEHRKVYDKIAEMFHFDNDTKTEYDGYNISHLHDEYEFFTDVVNEIDELEKNGEQFYITLIFD